jgi:hypothetical protein
MPENQNPFQEELEKTKAERTIENLFQRNLELLEDNKRLYRIFEDTPLKEDEAKREIVALTKRNMELETNNKNCQKWVDEHIETVRAFDSARKVFSSLFSGVQIEERLKASLIDSDSLPETVN